MNQWIVPVGRQLVWLAACITPWAMAANLTATTDSADVAATDWVAAPSPLLAIDQNRATVIDRIVREWAEPLARSSAGIGAEQLRELLSAMRADQLLAASLAGSLDGLRNVVSAAIVEQSAGKLAKSLGDAGKDVVYTPVTPCRLVDTRSFPAVYTGGGVFTPAEIRNYTVLGGNGQCLSQLPAGINAAGLQIQVFGIPTSGASGDIEVLPQGSTFGFSATLVVVGSIPFTSGSTTARVNQANNQISVQVRSAFMHVAIDVVGYFAAPVATALDCVATAETSAALNTTTRNYNTSSPACPVGYRAVSAVCEGGGDYFNLQKGGGGALPFGNNAHCFGRYVGASTVTVYVSAQCCRVPGR